MTTDLSRLSDGTYGRELGRVSPEGNIYGTTRWVRDVLRNFWWNGGSWLEIGEDIGQSNSVQLLPSTPQEPDTVWRCLDRVDESGRYVWKYFFWDAESQSWQPISWYWTVDSVQELPNNPWFRGQAHEVKEPDVQAMWDGYTWRRIRISSLEDDIGIVSTLETYGGTLQGLSPEVELIYISPVELTLKPINSDFEYVTVNSIVIDSSKRTSVYSFSPVLDWWDETESFSMSLLQHSTNENSEEYWVYLANKDDCFNLSTYDFRGRLFCSKTTPNNNRLGKFGSDAYNAVLIGRCQTAVPDDPSDRVEFLYELDVSLVSRAADLKETFREFSDFDLVYVDENTLRLDRTYGTMGQIFISGSLYYLGESIDLTNSDVRIIVDGNGLLDFDDSEIATDTIYYVYIASNSDIFNDNEINPATSMPWHPEDDGAGNGVDGPYYAAKDLRLKLFLSTKTPEEGRLAETWRGFWARHVGQVTSDGVGKFRYSASISSIRQATLNPTFFDGLAEMTLEFVSTSEMRIIRRKGTSGIVMVGGIGVQLFNSDDATVHKIMRTSPLYNYTEANPSNPLSLSGTQLLNHTTVPVYVYLANNRPCWGALAGQVFCSLTSPSDAYLSSNFPGNNARWVATLDMDATGYFTGSFVVDSINQPMLVIDDINVSPNTLWSSYKNQQSMDAYYNQLAALISAQNTFTVQQSNGIGARLQYHNSTTVVLYPTSGQNTSVVMPNLIVVNVPPSGLWLTTSGNAGIRYYVYLNSNGTLSMLATPPDNLYQRLETLGQTAVQVGDICLTSTNTMSGDWNICSSHNETTKQYYVSLSDSFQGVKTFTLPVTRVVVSRGVSGLLERTGSSYVWATQGGISGSTSSVRYGNASTGVDRCLVGIYLYQSGLSADVIMNNGVYLPNTIYMTMSSGIRYACTAWGGVSIVYSSGMISVTRRSL